jgi:hypothetical protein
MIAGISRLQLIGPFVLFGGTLLAEAAAYALAQVPSSPFLWYVNLEVFRIFNKGHLLLSEYVELPFAQLWLIAGPLAVLGLAGFMLRQRLIVAVSSNMSFLFACFLVFSWYKSEHSGAVASLSSIPLPSGDDSYLFTLLLTASLISFCVSHALYIREVRLRG